MRFLTRIADELRTALRRSPTVGHQVVREILIQSNLTSRALVDVHIHVALLHFHVIRAPHSHKRVRCDVPCRDVHRVPQLRSREVEESRTSGGTGQSTQACGSLRTHPQEGALPGLRSPSPC